MKLTKAVTHIKIQEANYGKLATPIFHSPLSQRWQRVAIRQAAGIAQSWRTNRDNAYHAYLEELSDYEEHRIGSKHDSQLVEPVWKEWNTPILKATSIQANANVVKPLLPEDDVVELEPSEKSLFDYWLRVSTLE